MILFTHADIMLAIANRTSTVVEMALEVPSPPSDTPYQLPIASDAMAGPVSGGSSYNASNSEPLSFWEQEEKELLRYAREFDRHVSRLFSTQRAVARLSSHLLDNMPMQSAGSQVPNAGTPKATNKTDLSVLEKDLEAEQKALRSTLTELYDAIANYTLRRYVVAQLSDTTGEFCLRVCLTLGVPR